MNAVDYHDIEDAPPNRPISYIESSLYAKVEDIAIQRFSLCELAFTTHRNMLRINRHTDSPTLFLHTCKGAFPAFPIFGRDISSFRRYNQIDATNL